MHLLNSIKLTTTYLIFPVLLKTPLLVKMTYCAFKVNLKDIKIYCTVIIHYFTVYFTFKLCRSYQISSNQKENRCAGKNRQGRKGFLYGQSISY